VPEDGEAALRAVGILIWQLVFNGVLASESVASALDGAAKVTEKEGTAALLYTMAWMARGAAWRDQEPANTNEDKPKP
jgi:hypothetical protein